MKRAVASMIRRGELYLVVWNKNFRGYGFPGGKVKLGETLFEANARELLEETGLVAKRQELVYQAREPKEDGFYAEVMQVSIVAVAAEGEPRDAEPGCPVAWFTEKQLLSESVFRNFYARMFKKLRR